MSISTHVLDIAAGRPAADVVVRLFSLRDAAADGVWEQIGSGRTDRDGRCRTLLGDSPLAALTYKIRFETGEYFHKRGLAGLYPYIEIVFTVAAPSQHYHIPLLLTANGYTTYRGA